MRARFTKTIVALSVLSVLAGCATSDKTANQARKSHAGAKQQLAKFDVDQFRLTQRMQKPGLSYVLCSYDTGGRYECRPTSKKTPKRKQIAKRIRELEEKIANIRIGKQLEKEGQAAEALKRQVTVEFYFDSDLMRLGEHKKIEDQIEVLRKSRSIWAVGFTDNIGDRLYNQKLARKRAESAKAYLVKLGIPAERIHTSGYGKCCYKTGNQTREQRMRNRRVEIFTVKRAYVEYVSKLAKNTPHDVNR